MNDSARVLGPGCGPLDANLVFVGEAPGRLGADGSHLPFHGDKSGHNFESLTEQVGISRYQVFVTNAVLCNPKDASGNNATPSPTEIANCAPFLKEQLEIIGPQVVVTLGAVALKACGLIEAHALSLRGNVRTSSKWFGRKLIPAYHPGQRAMVHRSFANQLADYQFIAESLRRTGKSKRQVSGVISKRASSEKLADVAKRLLEQQPDGLSYFALHKLCFLAEVAQLEEAGERMTNAYVVRQKDGPYFVDLHLAKLPNLVQGLTVEKNGGDIRLRVDAQRSFGDDESPKALSPSECKVVDRVSRRYGSYSEAELKRVVYLSGPMRALLRKERDLRVNLFNAAVLPYLKSS
jgi:uracil-DNA glycosylase family 4